MLLPWIWKSFTEKSAWNSKKKYKLNLIHHTFDWTLRFFRTLFNYVQTWSCKMAADPAQNQTLFAWAVKNLAKLLKTDPINRLQSRYIYLFVAHRHHKIHGHSVYRLCVLCVSFIHFFCCWFYCIRFEIVCFEACCTKHHSVSSVE